MKENGVISLNEHADSPEKVTTVKEGRPSITIIIIIIIIIIRDIL